MSSTYKYPINFEELEKLYQILARELSERSNSEQILNMEALTDLRSQYQIAKDALSLEELKSKIQHYLKHSTWVQGENFLGHQVAVPNIGSAIGDACNGVINNSAAVYDMGAAAIAIEKNLIDWSLNKIGWTSENASGILTHGGSIANLTALLAARAKKFPDSWKDGAPNGALIFTSEITHYCVKRAAAILGMGESSVNSIETDEQGHLKIAALENALQSARKNHQPVMAVVANAGATATGVFDPISDIAALCKSFDCYLHIDGAHGANFLLCPGFRKKHLQGIEYADSVVWDFHKGLQCSSLCAAVLFKDQSDLANAFNQDAPYLSTSDKPVEDSEYLFPYTIECTKPAIAFKAYLAIASAGESNLKNHLVNVIERTQEYFSYLNEQLDFNCPIEPETNILLFKYSQTISQRISQRKIYNEVLKRGKFHITFTEFKGEEFLRFTVTHPNSSLQTLQNLLQEIRSIGESIGVD